MIGRVEIGAEGRAAGIGMLDDDDRGLVEFRHQLIGGVGIVQIVVAQLLALELAGGGDAGAALARDVEGRALMGVLAIAQHLAALARQDQPRRQGLVAAHPAGDGGVIGGGAGEGGGGELPAQRQAEGALLRRHLGGDQRVVRGRGGDRDEIVILGRGADHRRPAHIDVLDAGGLVGAGPQRRLEGVEIGDQEIDGVDAMGLHGCAMGCIVAPRQEPAMDPADAGS